mmetsp:Transcript_24300/g.79267  ORF Transcript_24300/g.79267 Transcript_24300/m.79267 type:complete len:207 (-) Transcript_24300:68-688(-)
MFRLAHIEHTIRFVLVVVSAGAPEVDTRPSWKVERLLSQILDVGRLDHLLLRLLHDYSSLLLEFLFLSKPDIRFRDVCCVNHHHRQCHCLVRLLHRQASPAAFTLAFALTLLFFARLRGALKNCLPRGSLLSDLLPHDFEEARGAARARGSRDDARRGVGRLLLFAALCRHIHARLHRARHAIGVKNGAPIDVARRPSNRLYQSPL